jgi:hypothetical protein
MNILKKYPQSGQYLEDSLHSCRTTADLKSKTKICFKSTGTGQLVAQNSAKFLVYFKKIWLEILTL